MQIIFQDPYSSLNPRSRAEQVVREPLDVQNAFSDSERRDRVDELFNLVGLRPEQKSLFPHQFSGGQRQRLGHRARAGVVAQTDRVRRNPFSSLDVAIQAQILNLLSRLQQELGLAYLFISHDLAVIQHICDDVAVMYLGKIVVTRRTAMRFFVSFASVYAGFVVGGAQARTRGTQGKKKG